MAGTAIAQIVAIYACDHHIGKFEAGDRPRQLHWFVGIGWSRATMRHVAERAAPGAQVP